jgi:RNA polymerase sigma-70 factor (ECF subfamily)
MTTIEFNHQINQLHGTLEIYTHRFTRNSDDSKDLVQDTILKALIYKDKFKKNTNLKGWLYTIMRNIFINDYRKKKRNNTHLDDTEEQYHLNIPETYTHHLPISNLEYEEMYSTINQLRPDLKEPFKMHIEGYKYHEISEKLEIPIGTVKTRIFYARKEITSQLHQG